MTDDDLDHIPIEQRPAKTLMDVARTVTLQPLPVGDRRYVDLAPGAGTDNLELLRQKLQDAAAGAVTDEDGSNFLKMLISSHRGCGKTTELLRIESEVSQQFTSLHLGLDDSLRDEFDYTLFCLCLVEELADQFFKAGMPLPKDEVESVDRWFAEKIVTDKSTITGSVGLETEAEAKAGGGLLGFQFGFLSRAKASARGDRTRQIEIKSIMRRHSGELIDKVNQIFATASQTLRLHGRPDRLLIVQDNLDRLSRETALDFFEGKVEMLRDLRAHMIFTPPNAIILANTKIQDKFDDAYVLPMIKLRTMNGEDYQPGLDVMRAVVASRIDVSLFETPDLIDRLVMLSGGSVRDLIRLLSRAALRARSKKRMQINADDVGNAMAMMLDEFETSLMPSERYFSWLADIHRQQRDCLGSDEWRTEQRFTDLVLMGAVFAYKNRQNWYDVHPVILHSWLFEGAMKAAANHG